MKRLIPKKLPKHYVVVDTNILFQEDKSDTVSVEFTNFWSEYANKYDLELVIPEVVKGELLFQQTSVGLKLLERANEKFASLSKVAGTTYKHSHTARKVKIDVAKKIDSWADKVKALILDTPIQDIDWPVLIKKSIWREKPFTEDRKTEKGFRDALIYETLSHFVKTAGEIDIAFISLDKLLRETANEGLKKVTNLNTFQSLDDFESYLKLTDEQLTNEFVREIRKKASIKFFDHLKDSGLYYTESISNKIREQFSSEFTMPPNNSFLGLESLQHHVSNNKVTDWHPLNSGSFWIGQSLFNKKVGDSEFHWANKVSYIQLYKYSGSSTLGGLLSATLNGQINMLEIEFNVHWSSFVKTDTRFYSMKIENIEKIERRFSTPTLDEVKLYELSSYFEP